MQRTRTLHWNLYLMVNNMKMQTCRLGQTVKSTYRVLVIVCMKAMDVVIQNHVPQKTVQNTSGQSSVTGPTLHLKLMM